MPPTDIHTRITAECGVPDGTAARTTDDGAYETAVVAPERIDTENGDDGVQDLGADRTYRPSGAGPGGLSVHASDRIAVDTQKSTEHNRDR